MDGRHIKSFLGKRNRVDGGAVPTLQNTQIPPTGGGLNGNSWQPVAGGQGDIILRTEKSKNKKLFVVLSFVLAIILFVILWLFYMQEGESNTGAIDAEVLELTEDSYFEIVSIQNFLVKGKNGDIDAVGFFSEDSKKNIDDFLQTFLGFSERLNVVEYTSLRSEHARESISVLKNAINNDTYKYTKLVDVYDLFYEYVNSKYSPDYEKRIVGLDDEDVSVVLDKLKDVVNRTGGYESGTIVSDIFDIALGDNYPEVYYYEPIGKIIAELRYE